MKRFVIMLCSKSSYWVGFWVGYFETRRALKNPKVY